MLEILYKLFLSKEMACIYTDSSRKFNVGTILAINDEVIAIQSITPDGINDGIYVMDVEYISRVETNNQYIEKMKKLCSQETFSLGNVQIDNSNIINSVLMFAFKENQVVSIEFCDSGYDDVTGIIKAINDTYCKIEKIDEYGYVDGECYFLIDNVTHINVSREDEKRIMRLYEINRTNHHKK